MLIATKNFFLKPYFIALVLSLVVIWFLPNIFDKYEVQIVNNAVLDNYKNLQIYANDLDNDGYSEQIYSFDFFGNHSLQVKTHDGGIIDQWNPPGNIAGKTKRLVCGDYDDDGFNEIYTFYRRYDTVFLYCFEPMDTIGPMSIKEKVICVLNRKYNEPDPYFNGLHFKDINGDGKGELVFVIKNGQARIPRNLYLLDFANDTLLKSTDYGAVYDYNMNFIDFEEDGKLEIIGSIGASGNITDSLGYKYSDHSAWVMVFNNNLQLRFKPIEFPGFRSIVEVYPITIDSTPMLACFYNHRGTKENFPKLFLVDAEGTITKEHVFPKSEKNGRSLLVSKKNDITSFNIIDSYGHIMIFNKDLELIKEHDLNISINPGPIVIDLDKNGIKETLFSTKEGDLFITDQNFENVVNFKHEFIIPVGSNNLILNGGNNPYYFFYNHIKYIAIKYDKNPIYTFQYIIYLGIFLSFWLFIVAIQKLQLIQLQRNERIRNQIVNLQLKSFRNQMDPHFTFNVFNTMAYKVQKESPESYKAFMEFSNLIRKTLLSSDSITRTIEDELSHLSSYLELEKLRFSDKVSYSIEVDDNVNQKMHIPKMILQTYVENSIKHGIMHKIDSGLVSVSIRKENNVVLFEITDDGICREKAKELKTSGTGFGLSIMDNYFKLFNEYNTSKIKHEIVDLFDSQNNSIGTKVRILIPLNFSYKLKKP